MSERATRPSDQQAIAAIGHSFDLYEWTGGGPGYLHVHYIVLTPRLRERISALHAAPLHQHAAIMRQFASAIVD